MRAVLSETFLGAIALVSLLPLALALRHIRRLRQEIGTDVLTGVASRRAWEDQLAREVARAGRHGTSLCLALFDLDAFKGLNDRHGHSKGDAVLRSVGDCVRDRLRAGDLTGRLGGDEFGVILPACSLEDAEQTMNRLRSGISGESTCSVGVARWAAREDSEALMRRADQALYEAKRMGGDCTVKALAARVSADVARTSSAPLEARRALEPLCGEVEPGVYQSLRLLVSELVTNSVKFGGEGDIDLRVWVTPTVVRTEVIDQGHGFEPPDGHPPPGHDGSGGWGLHLVDRIAERWGAFEGSTHVWFELRRPEAGEDAPESQEPQENRPVVPSSA
jgi:diguanylate cyclase (GGDEF)-like protein